MLSPAHARHIIGLIEEGKQRALREERVVFITEDAFDGCIVPKKKKEELLRWKEEKGYAEGNILSAPKFDNSMGRRLHAKIMDKSRQIQSDTAGVIYLEGVPVYITKKGVSTRDFSREDIEEAVYSNENLLFTVLNSRSMAISEASQMFQGDKMYVARKIRYRLISDTAIVVLNRFMKFSTIRHKKIIFAFLN
jgi:hypothetical protein